MPAQVRQTSSLEGAPYVEEDPRMQVKDQYHTCDKGVGGSMFRKMHRDWVNLRLHFIIARRDGAD